jgi:hypothetical protein
MLLRIAKPVQDQKAALVRQGTQQNRKPPPHPGGGLVIVASA